jgi:hypothetical protein
VQRTPVSSSNVTSVGYDPGTATLEVEFHDGSVYQYFDLPAHEADGLVSASSVGGYLAAHIKGVYRYAKV